MSSLTGKAAQLTITPERIDKNRHRTPLFFGAIAVAAAMFSIPMLLAGSFTTALAMIYLTILIASYAAAAWCLRYFLSAGRTYWSHDSHRVVMTAPTGMLLFEVGVPLLGVLGIPLAAVTWLVRPQGDWIGSAALAALGALCIPYLLPVIRGGRSARRRITVSKSGIELTQANGHSHEIPWKAHPRLMGVRQADAVIVLKNHQEIHYPIGYLPMSMRQLERLLTTFSTDGQLRTKLSGPDALNTVLTVLEPTKEERTDGSWTWYSSGTTAKNSQ